MAQLNDLLVMGQSTLLGPVKSTSEISTTSANAFRAVCGSYGVFLRNDGNHTYFLVTNSGDQYGNWSGLRPFYFNNENGNVTMNHTLNMGGPIQWSTNSVAIKPNTTSSYGGFQVSGARGSYNGILIGTKDTAMTIMSQDGGYQGLYTQKAVDPNNANNVINSNLGWMICGLNRDNYQIGIGTSGFASGYKITMAGSTYVNGNIGTNGVITSSKATSLWVQACNGESLLNSSLSGGVFQPMLSGGTTYGRMTLAFYNNALQATYITQANCSAGTNSPAYTALLFDESGGASWPGTVSVNQLSATTIKANNSVGTSGYVLKSGGSGSIYWAKDDNTTYDIATTSALGLVKSTTTGNTADRYYNVEVNSDGTMRVNVPWTYIWQANTSYQNGYVTAGAGHANQVWKCDDNGVPGWRNHGKTYSAGTNISISTADEISVVNSPTFSGTVTANSFYALSDKRLKENLCIFTPKKSILDLPIYKFDFIKGIKNQIGCIAQDLQKICPEIVEEDENGYLSINESKIVYLLIDEVKKLKEEINKLKGDK